MPPGRGDIDFDCCPSMQMTDVGPCRHLDGSSRANQLFALRLPLRCLSYDVIQLQLSVQGQSHHCKHYSFETHLSTHYSNRHKNLAETLKN